MHLQTCDLFALLSEDCVTRLAEASRQCSLRRDERLLAEGEAAVALVVVVSGRLRITQMQDEGNDGVATRIGSAEAGDCVGETALLPRAFYHVTAEADTECTIA